MARIMLAIVAGVLLCASATAQLLGVPATSAFFLSSNAATFPAATSSSAAIGDDLYNVFATLANNERSPRAKAAEFRNAVATSAPRPRVTLVATVDGLTKPRAAQAMGVFGGESHSLKSFSSLMASAPSRLALSDVYVSPASLPVAVAAARPSRARTVTIAVADAAQCSAAVDAVTALAGSSAAALVNVRVPSVDALPAFDACVPQLAAAVDAASGSSYVVALVGAVTVGGPKANKVVFPADSLAAAQGEAEAGDAAAFIEIAASTGLRAGAHAGAGAGVAAGAVVYNGPEYVTSDVVTVLVVSFLLLGILWLGLSFAMSVESPVRYATPAMVLPFTREY